MNYLIHQDNMDELNEIVGQQGGVIPTEVSNALADVQTAIAMGDDDKATKALNTAIAANKKNGAAWANVQEWHDERINEDQYGGSDPGTDPGPPAIPGNAITCSAAPGENGGMKFNPEITINGKNYGCHVKGGPGAPWYYTKANYDGDTSMSCDGKQIFFSVTDMPTDPAGGQMYNNTSGILKYKKGQSINMRIGEGGYYNDTTLLVSVAKYGA